MNVNDKVVMSDIALENYGVEWEGVELIITHKAINTSQHQGYDTTMQGQGLYDLKRADNDEDLNNSLYDYELIEI